MRQSANLGEDVLRLFEEAEVAELEPIATSEKKPLQAALKDIGISGTPKTGVHWMELQCDTDQEYHEYCRILSEPDTIAKLGERGWVSVKLGDAGMLNEPPQYRLGFIEIQTHVAADKDKPDQSIQDILDQGQKFATTPVAVDTEDNPVERETGEPDTKQGAKAKGVGDAKDGAEPEGKPKGSEKKVKESARARQIVDRLLNEMTSTSGMGTVTAGLPPALADNPNQVRRKRKRPGHPASPPWK